MYSAKWPSIVSGKALLALLITPLIASCAVHSPPKIQHSTGNVVGISSITLLSSEGDKGGRTSFQKHLYNAFQVRGVSENENSSVIGDFAISALPGDMALASFQKETSRNNDRPSIEVKSDARHAHLFDNCEPIRIRATLILLQRGTGKLIHRAESEAQACKDSTLPLANMADKLVHNALDKQK